MKTPLIHEERFFRPLFAVTALLVLFFLLAAGREAGISGDEEVHYRHSIHVYDYYASHGTDKSALDTPKTHLKYYGQSFDNLTTILIRWFNIDDIYGFRHLMNGMAAWLAVFISALMAVWLSGYGAGWLTLLLFALSPTFLGHAQNNLKDIPFALAYLAGTFFMLKWLFAKKKSALDALWLIISSAFCISIRPGGALLLCYLLLFVLIKEILDYRKTRILDVSKLKNRATSILLILASSYLLGILLWPYVLENPLKGFLESYQVMTRFPTTIRQIFEGIREWSDFMPWYYLPKLMLITIPLVVWAGLIGWIAIAKSLSGEARLKFAMLIFTIIFPVIFVIYEKSNLYGSWRHFLFIYPGFLVLSAIGWRNMIAGVKAKLAKVSVISSMTLLAIHPVGFMISNHPYYYLYYNQLTGGLKGAYGNYETDYYYHSMREGSEWLIRHLDETHSGDSLVIGTNFPADWFFRKHANLKAKYLPYDERSQSNWDYYIVTNSYISPQQLKSHRWPPKNSIKTIEVDGVPVCAVLKRDNKLDLSAYQALIQNRTEEAVKYFEEVIKKDCTDDRIFYNFACACYKLGDKEKTIALLKKGLEINPGSEDILMFLANIYAGEGDSSRAEDLYGELIKVNRKYFDAYPALAKIWIGKKEYKKARVLLKQCLVMNPDFVDAILGLADSYRSTDPVIAKKYDDLAKIKQL